MNNVNLLGRLTKDPELRYLKDGTAVANFILAVDRGLSKTKKEELEAEGKQTADFIRITTWRKVAENCANHLAKGLRVIVSGRMQTGSHENEEGRTIYTTDVVAHNVEFIDWKDDLNTKSENEPQIEGFSPTDNSDIPF